VAERVSRIRSAPAGERGARHRALAGPSLAAALLALGLCLPPGAGADPPDRRPPGSFAVRYAEGLGVDAEGQARIQEIVARSGLRDAALRDELHAARQRIRDLMDATHHPDEAAVMAQADAIGALEAEIHKNRLRAIFEIRELLSPEQRQQLLRIRDEKHPRRRGIGGMEECGRDLRVLCGAEEGRAGLACLLERWDELSAACREAFEFPEPGGHADREAP